MTSSNVFFFTLLGRVIFSQGYISAWSVCISLYTQQTRLNINSALNSSDVCVRRQHRRARSSRSDIFVQRARKAAPINLNERVRSFVRAIAFLFARTKAAEPGR